MNLLASVCRYIYMICSSPKPVFNGNRRGFGNGPPRGSPQNSVSPQHEDIVKYLSDGEYDSSTFLGALSPINANGRGGGML